jgi:hypothetical protein
MTSTGRYHVRALVGDRVIYAVAVETNPGDIALALSRKRPGARIEIVDNESGEALQDRWWERT